ncbi:SAC domain containing protein 9, putative [Acanthamoeba castellanii str. Neff]|uniref:SAC domain containing protein 9, putative n=1 Tax=Acanthamoeba castellanii (strain ATCC 30010 / Neff) TaxID=1257118 RepID=L8GG35_ACACF|nr:SAC domain containing protein 9, putative [Acanthamoeba castellanii str. Neff]ELR12040.1 SAC domain containing protein 9, putative [Acanthamoeba castellanii str. Neff]
MRKDTTILAVHPETGALQFAAVKGKDIFLNESEAVAYLKANYQLKNATDMTLPGGHGVFTIMEAKWMKMDLNYLGSPNKVEARNMEVMQDFPLEGLHFYCDTFDITRPYPSPYPVDQEGLRMWCVVMLQGVALTKTIPVASHKPALHLGVLTRKSTINAGTRYYARGLNKAGGPGNESECELLMWTTTAHSDLVCTLFPLGYCTVVPDQ